jgi:DNA polymerase-1
MIRVQELIDKNHFLSKLIIQVHDELVLDVVKEELDIITNEVKEIMENVIHLNVPLKVDIGHGKNWLEAH